MDVPPIGQLRDKITVTDDILQGGTEHQFHPLGPQVVVEIGSHLRVQRGHDLLRTLYYGDLHAHVHQVLGDLQTYVSASGDDRPFDGIPGHELPHGLRILHRAERHDIRITPCGQLRDYSLGTGGEYQTVVGLIVLRTVLQTTYMDCLRLPVDGDDLVPDPGIDVESAPERLGTLQGELGIGLYGSTHVIWESTVRVRNESGALDNDDLRILIQPPQPGCCGCPSGHSSDYDDLHKMENALEVDMHSHGHIGNNSSIRVSLQSYMDAREPYRSPKIGFLG